MKRGAHAGLTLLSAVKHRLRHGPDRLLHPLRRRRAVEVVRSSGARTILFVCLGNICRSPYAAAAFEQQQADANRRVQTASAGFIGPGRPSPEDAIQAAAARGTELAAHRSRMVTPSLVEDSDLVVAMEPRHLVLLEQSGGLRGRPVLLLGDLDTEAIRTRSIPDPIHRERGVFEHVFARIDRCLRVLAEVLADARVDGPDANANLVPEAR